MEWQGQLILLLIAVLGITANAGIGLLFMVIRRLTRNQERLWTRVDKHVEDPELHPDIDRLRRLEQLANGRQT